MDQESPSQEQSYFQILKSMAMIGGSSLVNVGFAIVRNKAMAVILGPAGVGQMSLYTAIVDLTQTIAGLGVQPSGVRQIAEAVGAGDTDRIARIATVLRWTSVTLGCIGMVLLVLLSDPIANVTFGNSQNTAAVALLSLAIFFQLVAGAQMALIQGMRDIANLARVNIVAGFFATGITIALAYLLGMAGIAPSIVASAFAMLVVSWWYGRRVQVRHQALSAADLKKEVSPLLKLGLVFMISSLLMVGSYYVIRLIIMREGGVGAAGLYQAAWAIGGLYAGFILQAMGADFFPRLAALIEDHVASNRLVNEQTQVSLLLAGPGVIATLTFAPVAMWLFYSPQFSPAAEILRWVCLGMMLRIASWPMGFILVAKGARTILYCVEIAAAAVHIGLAWLLVPHAGTVGAGVAFFGLYVWHAGVVYVFSHRLTGFSWSIANVRLCTLFLAGAGLAFGSTYLLPPWQALFLGALTTLASGVYSLRCLFALIPPETLPKPVRNWIARFA